MKIGIELKPLSVNQAWQGRRFKTKAYQQFILNVRALVPEARRPVEGFVEVHYKFYLRLWQNTDGDNCVKCIQDIIVKLGYIEDDRKIMKYIIEKIPCDEDYIEIDIRRAKL